MNDQYFLKINCFSYTKYLTILTLITTIAFLPYSAIGRDQAGAEFINDMAPSRGSTNNSVMNSTHNQIESMATVIAYNETMHAQYSMSQWQWTLPIILNQITEYRRSLDKTVDIQEYITDETGYGSSISQGAFDQRDWDERREQAAIQLRASQDYLATQALLDYADKVHKDIQKEINNNSKIKDYKFNPKTNIFTLPDGKSIAAKDIFTPEGFKTLGHSSKEFDEFKKQQKQFEKKAKRQAKATINNIIQSAKRKAKRIAAEKAKATNGSNDSLHDSITHNNKTSDIAIAGQKRKGGYGSRGSSFSSDWRALSFQEILNKHKIKNGGLNSERELTMLSKRYGNDLIGLASNNIFDMIHRQYLRRRSQMMDTSPDAFIAERSTITK